MTSNARPTTIPWGRAKIPGGGAIELSSYRFGEGSPRRVIIAGLHGDESTPIFVLEHFVRNVVDTVTGTIDVVPAVNWAGLLLGHRRYPFGGIDLNRALAPEVANAYARGLIDDLVAFCRGAYFVLDLHSWDSPTILMGICHTVGGQIAKRSLDVLARLGCRYIWVPEHERDVRGTLGQGLTDVGVAHASVEMSPAWLATEGLIAEYSSGLSTAFSNDRISSVPPSGGRVAAVSQEAGFFVPRASPGDSVASGQACGVVLDARLLEVVSVVSSPVTGMVLQIETRRSIFPGQIVAFIGPTGCGADRRG